jgi:imidazolonepropionase-like amidohydrolase
VAARDVMNEPGGDFTVITAARVLDGLGGPAIDDGGVLIQARNIVRVGPRADLRAPEGATVNTYHQPGATVMPGFVDAHTHPIAPGDGTAGEELGASEDELLVTHYVANVRRMLNMGITTARDNGAKNRVAFAVREAIRRGIVPGPRMVICGRAVTSTGGHLHFFGGEADGDDGVRRAVRQLIKEGADYIKIMATGGSTLTSDVLRPAYGVEELTAIVQEAHRRGRLTAAHTTSTLGVEYVLGAGVDMIIHCHFFEADGSYRYRPDLVDRAIEAGRWFNPTIYIAYAEIEGLESKLEEAETRSSKERATAASPADVPILDNLASERRSLDIYLEALRRMIDQGAKVIAGSDTPWRWAKPGGLAKEVAVLGLAGLSNRRAIVAGTSGAAESIGAGEVAGRLAAGRQADVVVVDGDPLTDLAAMQRVVDVWQAGRRVERTS